MKINYIQPGQDIRSYDHIQIDDSYMEGSVIEILNGLAKCKCNKIVRAGVAVPEEELPEFFMTPQIGDCLFDDRQDRVTVAGTSRKSATNGSGEARA